MTSTVMATLSWAPSASGRAAPAAVASPTTDAAASRSPTCVITARTLTLVVTVAMSPALRPPPMVEFTPESTPDARPVAAGTTVPSSYSRASRKDASWPSARRRRSVLAPIWSATEQEPLADPAQAADCAEASSSARMAVKSTEAGICRSNRDTSCTVTVTVADASTPDMFETVLSKPCAISRARPERFESPENPTSTFTAKVRGANGGGDAGGGIDGGGNAGEGGGGGGEGGGGGSWGTSLGTAGG